MPDIFSAIQYVAGGFSLVAFVVAAIFYGLRLTLEHRQAIIKSLPERTRMDAVFATAEYLRIDPKKIPPEQLREIVLAQIRARSQRDLTRAIMAFGIALLLAIVTIVAITRSKADDSGKSAVTNPTVTTPPVEVCKQEPPSQDARDTIKRYAAFLKPLIPHLRYKWSGGNVANGVVPKEGVPVTDIVASGDDLIVKYDWQEGKLTIRPIDVGYSSTAIPFVGAWHQTNGNGCVSLDFPLLQAGQVAGPSVTAQELVSGTWSTKDGDSSSAAITCTDCQGLIPGLP